MFDECISKDVVGHVPLNRPNSSFQFIIFAFFWLESEWTEFGLEIPLDYICNSESRVKTWLKKAIEKVENSLNVKGEKVVKYKHLKIE